MSHTVKVTIPEDVQVDVEINVTHYADSNDFWDSDEYEIEYACVNDSPLDIDALMIKEDEKIITLRAYLMDEIDAMDFSQFLSDEKASYVEQRSER